MKETIRSILPSSDLMLAGRYTPTKDMRDDILIFYIRTHTQVILSHTHAPCVMARNIYIYTICSRKQAANQTSTSKCPLKVVRLITLCVSQVMKWTAKWCDRSAGVAFVNRHVWLVNMCPPALSSSPVLGCVCCSHTLLYRRTAVNR